MRCPVNKLIKPALCLLVLLHSAVAKAQISLVQNLLDKMESYHNISYRSVNKLKDMSADTTLAHNRELFLKAPGDKLYGYLYSIETDHKTENFHKTDLYNGRGLNILSVRDSTYFPNNGTSGEFGWSVFGGLRFLRDRYHAKPFNVTLLKDTMINGKANTHFVANAYDTVDTQVHLYSNRDYYIDKQTGLPALVIIKGRYKYNGVVNEYYNETRYFDYKLNSPDITQANFDIPRGFSPRAEQAAPPALLDTGTTAPNWTLYDANGKKLSLTELRGKVVLMDFYFIGCSGCMASIKPLNTLYEKYKNKGLVIASLTERDSKRAVLDFEKRFKVGYSGYINAAEVVKAYHVSAFPTFYFIDREGKIANVFVGSKELEEKAASVIESLLNKK
jgi:peroxiredoxin